MSKSSPLDDILNRLRSAQADLEAEIERLTADQRERFHYSLRRGRVVFEKNVRRLQRQQRTRTLRYLIGAPIGFLLSAPIIYGMIIPLALLDLTISIYQHICFRIYGIPLVRRAEYIVIDRHNLAYLNTIEKLNCVYCGYGNGLIAYAREITARTEQFWCPIKHARRARDAHERSLRFFEYGDAEAWQRDLASMRKDWGRARPDAAGEGD